MFSKTLIKLIDASIFPAVFLVASKILAIAFISKYFDTSYQIEGMKLVFNNAEDFITINSYSSLIMFFAVFAGLIWVVIKAHVFHDTHVKPTVSAQLLDMNLLHLVHKSDVIYSEAFVWLSYAWLTTLMIGVYSLFGLGYWWVFGISLVITILTTSAMAVDFERELKVEKRNENSNGNDFEISFSPKKLIRFSDLSKEVS